MNDVSPFLKHIAARVGSDDAFVLDLGCGPGWFRRLSKGRYVGCDITTASYGEDRPRLVDVVGSARLLPFREGAFDLVFVVAALHLFSAPVLCLKDICRVLKPGGRFLCFDYTRRTHRRLCEALYPQTDVTSYNMLDGRSMVEMCQAAGFAPVTLGCFLPGLSLHLPLPRLARPWLTPLLDRRRGWWVVEGRK